MSLIKMKQRLGSILSESFDMNSRKKCPRWVRKMGLLELLAADIAQHLGQKTHFVKTPQ